MKLDNEIIEEFINEKTIYLIYLLQGIPKALKEIMLADKANQYIDLNKYGN